MLPITTAPNEAPEHKSLTRSVGETLLKFGTMGLVAGGVIGAGIGSLSFIGPGVSSVVAAAFGLFTGPAGNLGAAGLTAIGTAIGSLLGLTLSIPAGITKGVMNHKIQKTEAMVPIIAKEAMMRGINIGQQLGQVVDQQVSASITDGKHVASLNEKRSKQIDLASAQPMGRA